MIDGIEELLQHWADQCRRIGLGGGGVRSPLGAVMDWQGTPPRMGRGACAPVGSLGVDEVAQAVDRVLAELRRKGEQQDQVLAKAWADAGQSRSAPFCLDTQLFRLARVRYLTEPMPTIEQQCRRLKICSARTYHRRVDELHEWVRDALERHSRRAA